MAFVIDFARRVRHNYFSLAEAPMIIVIERFALEHATIGQGVHSAEANSWIYRFPGDDQPGVPTNARTKRGYFDQTVPRMRDGKLALSPSCVFGRGAQAMLMGQLRNFERNEKGELGGKMHGPDDGAMAFGIGAETFRIIEAGESTIPSSVSGFARMSNRLGKRRR